MADLFKNGSSTSKCCGYVKMSTAKKTHKEHVPKIHELCPVQLKSIFCKQVRWQKGTTTNALPHIAVGMCHILCNLMDWIWLQCSKADECPSTSDRRPNSNKQWRPDLMADLFENASSTSDCCGNTHLGNENNGANKKIFLKDRCALVCSIWQLVSNFCNQTRWHKCCFQRQPMLCHTQQ